jgi:hypothetical protein
MRYARYIPVAMTAFVLFVQTVSKSSPILH